MILSLKISNFALIRDIQLQPGAGLNIITGETGAGKSIIMGALSLLQGRRAENRGADRRDEKTVVEAVFSLTPAIAEAVGKVLAEAGIDSTEDTTCVLRREIMPSGRSRASINGIQVQLAILGAVADLLVDIHSQHKNMLLADEAFQRDILDTLAGNHTLLAQYHKVYADYRVALQRFARTRDEIENTRTDADYLEYQLNELATLDLEPGEEEELTQQRDILANASTISEQLSQAANALAWSNANASDMMALALEAMREAAAVSDEYMPLLDRLESIKAELDDISETIADGARTMSDDPKALDEIEKRLDRIHALETKHRVDSVDALIAIRDHLTERLEALNDAPNTLKQLENEARALKREALEKANTLSARRKEAASDLIRMLTSRARPLGMDNLVIDIRVNSGKLNPDGIDNVEFLFAFNKNQQPSPIGSHASGGEISRVMLALKSITADRRQIPTIIFDEIDTGVSGDVANRMGALMADIGHHMQVLTITHLPGVAARGSQHFKVFKRDDESGTATYITQLDNETRRAELALMLSGNPADPASLAAADSLLNQ